jgi:Zn-dependent oligopeptidase
MIMIVIAKFLSFSQYVGHGLQHMLTKASVGDVAGINGVEWDAVELPSQVRAKNE